MREARRVAGITLALGAWLAVPARAQTADQPNLIFTIFGRLPLRGGNLWTIPRQLALAESSGTGFVWDTVSLARKLRTGFSATLAATYFRHAAPRPQPRGGLLRHRECRGRAERSAR